MVGAWSKSISKQALQLSLPPWPSKGQGGERLQLLLQNYKATVIVTGPDDTEWRHDVTVNDSGSFYDFFEEKTVATGIYHVTLELADDDGVKRQLGAVTFKKEPKTLVGPELKAGQAAPDFTCLTGLELVTLAKTPAKVRLFRIRSSSAAGSAASSQRLP